MLVGMQISIALGEDTIGLSKQPKAELSLDPAVQLLYLSIVTEIEMLKIFVLPYLLKCYSQ